MAKTNNLTDFLTDIANTIRSFRKTTNKINPQDFNSQIAELYGDTMNAGVAQGKQDAITAFWNGFQWYGERTSYEQAFQRWYDTGMGEPMYKVVLDSNSRDLQMFDGNTAVTKITADKYDFSNASCNDKGSTYGHYATFRNCSNLEYIEDIGMKAGYWYGTFQNCSKLHTIAIMRFTKDTKITQYTFENCTSLKNITFDGTIADTQIFFKTSPLSATSVKSLLDHLDTATSTTARKVALLTSVKENYDTIYGDWDSRVAELTSSGNWSFYLV